jgi:hypothetical protein
MDVMGMSQSPFAALTFVAAPALLTNASSVLAMSTINRMLRTRESMKEVYAKSRIAGASHEENAYLVRVANRVERQATFLMRALRSVYIALAAFACATLVTLLGAGVAPFMGPHWPQAMASLGVVMGAVGVGGLVYACANLFHATQLSILNIREEAGFVRLRCGEAGSSAKSGDVPPAA